MYSSPRGVPKNILFGGFEYFVSVSHTQTYLFHFITLSFYVEKTMEINVIKIIIIIIHKQK